jgi:hypothetical protein
MVDLTVRWVGKIYQYLTLYDFAFQLIENANESWFLKCFTILRQVFNQINLKIPLIMSADKIKV